METLTIEAARDLATEKGQWTLDHTTFRDYLTRLGILDPADQSVDFSRCPRATFQRWPIAIAKNPIKKRMLRDLLRGGTLPPIVVYDRGNSWDILDGLQRTHVLAEALRALMSRASEDKLEGYAEEQFQQIAELGQHPLSVDEFLVRPLTLQVWKHLEAEELIRLFMVLNVGQQKVSPRHLLEALQPDLREAFQEWGMKLLTELEEKALPRRIRRKGEPDDRVIPIPSVTHFRYEYLLDGLQAYVDGDPHIKTQTTIQNEDASVLSDRVMEIGSEVCKLDFQWVCLTLNQLVREKYKGQPAREFQVQNADNFFIPLLAALGKARATTKTMSTVEHHKAELLEILTASEEEDPLRFGHLEAVQATVKSNIGRKRRAIVYFAWRQLFLRGPYSEEDPLDWSGAAVAD
jgi:hypothetical protein